MRLGFIGRWFQTVRETLDANYSLTLTLSGRGLSWGILGLIVMLFLVGSFVVAIQMMFHLIYLCAHWIEGGVF